MPGMTERDGAEPLLMTSHSSSAEGKYPLLAFDGSKVLPKVEYLLGHRDKFPGAI